MTFPLAFDPVLFWLLFGLTVLALLALRRINAPLTTDAAPGGIVSLQLAKLPKARQILDSWQQNPPARLHAAMGLGFDYLFLALYGTTIALGCVESGEVLASVARPIDALAPWLAWGAWLAAGLDAIENVALWRMLQGEPTAQLTAVARGCAIPKLILVAVALLYVLAGLAAWILT